MEDATVGLANAQFARDDDRVEAVWSPVEASLRR